jgi:MFS family permease
MGFSPADQSYWPQSFPAVTLSAIGGLSLFNITNVYVSSALSKEDQGLGQGIFNTVSQLATAISLAIAATVANAHGVTHYATKSELLNGYRAVFYLCAGVLAIPLVASLFLKGKKASENGDTAVRENKAGSESETENESDLEKKESH